MAKNKSMYICQECGYESMGWLGKCPACNQWNTFVEEVRKQSGQLQRNAGGDIQAVYINDIALDNEERYSTGISEMDRVLGGGIIKGSLVLVGGDPGIGKSTLLLQVCERIKINSDILYVSGEESVKQIKLRADRLGIKNKQLRMVAETDFGSVAALIEKERPAFAIIDSIQTMFISELTSAPGSVAQVREVTTGLMKLAKGLGIAIFIVGLNDKEMIKVA